MTNLILWSTMLVAYFIYNWPPLQRSERMAARITKTILSILIGGVMGFGLGRSLGAVIAG